MKRFFAGLCFLTLVISFSACKKCFHCYNACVACTRTVGGHDFSHTLCVDSFPSQNEYQAAIAQDTTIGYTCVSTTPTYDYDFCVNQPGEKSYPSYFNRGQRATCDEK
jgi:hypothetical protein